MTLSCGRFAIFYSPTGACHFLQLKQSLRVLFIAALPFMIQNLSLIMENMCFVPECPEEWWYNLMIKQITWCEACRIIRCLTSSLTGAFSRCPHARSRPSINWGSSLKILLYFLTWGFLGLVGLPFQLWHLQTLEWQSLPWSCHSEHVLGSLFQPCLFLLLWLALFILLCSGAWVPTSGSVT